jgi:hypothetical protein
MQLDYYALAVLEIGNRIASPISMPTEETHIISSRRRVHKWVHKRVLTRCTVLATT